MRIARSFCLAAATALCFQAAAQAPEDLRFNQIQVVGTHNSYHQRPPEPMFSELIKAHPEAVALDYAHAPLDVQLDRGVRSFEIDVYYYPEQGLRVLHIPKYDAETSVETFKDALQVVKKWSDAHPNHVPISFLIEAKDEPMPEVGETIHRFTAEAFGMMDAEIREVFAEDRLFTPDDLRGGSESLPQAIEEGGWPLLDDMRGQVLICLHEKGRLAEVYAQPGGVLENRPMFLRGEEGKPWSAVFVVDNPYDPQLPGLVRAGYIVRTRADANLKEAAAGETARRDAAFESGAHIVSTDYPAGEPHEDTGYIVALPEGAAARVNPVSAPGAEDAVLPAAAQAKPTAPAKP